MDILNDDMQFGLKCFASKVSTGCIISSSRGKSLIMRLPLNMGKSMTVWTFGLECFASMGLHGLDIEFQKREKSDYEL
eukprot:scaffold61868_cov129-Cyclotella_meneghiniana.AAC.1